MRYRVPFNRLVGVNFMDLGRLAGEVTATTGVELTPRDVERVIASVARSSHFWEILGLARVPYPAAAETIRLLQDQGLVQVDGTGAILLTAEGQAFVKVHALDPGQDFTCPGCGGRGLDLGKLKSGMQEFEELAKGRPEALLKYDQGHLTTASVMARVALMAERGDLAGKRLLVLGDDDLLGLAAALTGLPQEVVVLEVDDRLVHYINDQAAKSGLPVKAHKYDFKDQLPDRWVKYFDTFNADPPETLEALKVCLTRGLCGLAGAGCAGYFGLTRTEASLKKWHLFQAMLLAEFKVAITDIIDNFNHYANWGYLLESIGDDYPFAQVAPKLNWFKSSMYRIEMVSGFEGVENKPMSCELYLDEEALIYHPRNHGGTNG